MAIALAEFEPILREFLLPDNEVRNAAEARLVAMKAEPDTLLMSLVQALRCSADEGIRSLAAVLIRRVLTQDEVSIWGTSTVETQRTLQAELLTHLKAERVTHIRNKVTNTVAEIGMVTLEMGAWPELMPAVHAMIHGEDMGLRRTALRLFEELSYYIASCLQELFGEFRNVFASLLADPTNTVEVKVAAVRAAAGLIISVEKPSERQGFSPLIAQFVDLVNATLVAGDFAASKELISVMIDLADDAGTVFKSSLQPMIQTALNAANEPSLPAHVRHLAIELVTSTAEHAPYLLRKLKDRWFVLNAMPVVFGLMLDLNDDADWESKDDDSDERENRNVAVGEECLDRLADAIGANSIMPVVLEIVQQFLAAEEWKYKYVGLMALSQTVDILDGTDDQLKELVEQVLPFVGDAHPRVRYAAVDVLGCLANAHPPTFQDECHPQVMPALGAVLGDPRSPRCQGHACEALSNFADNSLPNVLEPYIDDLLRHVFEILGSGSPKNKLHALHAMNSVADAAQKHFGRFYEIFAGVLKTIVTDFTAPEHRELRGEAIMALTIVGDAAGVEAFRADAVAVMELLLSESATAAMTADDPMRLYVWTSYGRIVGCLGPEEFAPFTGTVMPSLVAAATDVSEMVPVNADEPAPPPDYDDDGDDSDEEPLEDARKGKVQFKVKTANLRDKAEAMRIIAIFAAKLKEEFLPWVNEAAGAALPLITEYEGEAYDDVRSYSMAMLTDIVLCVSRAEQLAAVRGLALDGVSATDLFHAVLDASLKAMAKESAMELMMTLVQTVKVSIENMSEIPEEVVVAAGGEGAAAIAEAAALGASRAPKMFRQVLDADGMTRVIKDLLVMLQNSSNRRATRHAQATVDKDDIDDEEYDRIQAKDEREHELQFYCTDTMGALVKTHKEAFLPVFKAVLYEKVKEMANPACLPNDRKLALFLADDLVEQLGPLLASDGLLDEFVKWMLMYCEDPDVEVRQAAAFGLGAGASSCGEAFAPYAAQAAMALGRIVQDPAARETKENESVHDNAVSALGKVILCQSGHIECGEVIPFFVDRLPLKFDKDESRVATQQLLTLLATGNPYVFGEGGAALPKALEALAQSAVVKRVLTEGLAARIVSVVKGLQAALPEATFNAALAGASTESQEILGGMVADPKFEAVGPTPVSFDVSAGAA